LNEKYIYHFGSDTAVVNPCKILFNNLKSSKTI
jgi:hypothetical protein